MGGGYHVVSISDLFMQVHLSARHGFDCGVHRNTPKSCRRSWFLLKSDDKKEYAMLSLENCSLWLNTCFSWSPERGATSHLSRLSRSRLSRSRWHLQGCSVATAVGGTSPLFCRRETSGCKREDLCVAWRTLQLVKDGLISFLCSS